MSALITLSAALYASSTALSFASISDLFPAIVAFKSSIALSRFAWTFSIFSCKAVFACSISALTLLTAVSSSSCVTYVSPSESMASCASFNAEPSCVNLSDRSPSADLSDSISPESVSPFAFIASICSVSDSPLSFQTAYNDRPPSRISTELFVNLPFAYGKSTVSLLGS